MTWLSIQSSSLYVEKVRMRRKSHRRVVGASLGWPLKENSISFFLNCECSSDEGVQTQNINFISLPMGVAWPACSYRITAIAIILICTFPVVKLYPALGILSLFARPAVLVLYE